MAITKLSDLLRSRWVLLLVLAIFVACKVPHLSYPFYCDEGWVYAPAVKAMAANGPSLLPGSIPSDLSRGHPLLFHFLCSLWIRCFGVSNAALHSFPLAFSVFFLIALHEVCRKLFGTRVATLALLLVATQVIFFVQASFVLPEIMVALFALLSLYCYVQDRFVLLAIVLSLLFFTKESGVVFGAVMGVDALVCLFTRKSERLLRRAARIAAIVAPTLLIACFFVLQKAIEGWYLLPLHSNLIQTDWDYLYGLFRDCLRWTFKGDIANVALFLFVTALSALPAIKQRNARYLFLVLPAIIVFILTDKWIVEHTGDLLWMLLFVSFFSVACYAPLYLNRQMNAPARKFVVLLGCCFGAYLCFSSLTVLTYRYLLIEIIFVLIFLAVCINIFIEQSYSSFYPVTLSAILVAGVLGIYTDDGHDDTDLEAFHAMTVQKSAICYLEQKLAFDKEINAACFWELAQLTDTNQGFLNTGKTFTHINWDTATANTDYVILDNICWNGRYEQTAKNPLFKLVYRATSGRSWTEVYQRK